MSVYALWVQYPEVCFDLDVAGLGEAGPGSATPATGDRFLECKNIPRSLLRDIPSEIRAPPGQPRIRGAVQAARILPAGRTVLLASRMPRGVALAKGRRSMPWSLLRRTLLGAIHEAG